MIKIKDSNGKEYSIQSYNSNYGDNTVEKKHDAQLRKILLNGGDLKFRAVTNRFGSPSEYKFRLNNADFLENALIKARIKEL